MTILPGSMGVDRHYSNSWMPRFLSASWRKRERNSACCGLLKPKLPPPVISTPNLSLYKIKIPHLANVLVIFVVVVALKHTPKKGNLRGKGLFWCTLSEAYSPSWWERQGRSQGRCHGRNRMLDSHNACALRMKTGSMDILIYNLLYIKSQAQPPGSHLFHWGSPFWESHNLPKECHWKGSRICRTSHIHTSTA